MIHIYEYPPILDIAARGGNYSGTPTTLRSACRDVRKKTSLGSTIGARVKLRPIIKQSEERHMSKDYLNTPNILSNNIFGEVVKRDQMEPLIPLCTPSVTVELLRAECFSGRHAPVTIVVIEKPIGEALGVNEKTKDCSTYMANVYKQEGGMLADALLDCLPGGTIDALLVELVAKKSSLLAVPYVGTKE